VIPWIWTYTDRFVPIEVRKTNQGNPLNSVGGGDLIQPYRRPETKP
jgi:hypothetical protein